MHAVTWLMVCAFLHYDRSELICFFLQLLIRSSESFYRAIEMVYVQFQDGDKMEQNAATLICPQHIEYDMTDIPLVFISELRT